MPAAEPPEVRPRQAIRARDVTKATEALFTAPVPGADMGVSHVGNNSVITKSDDLITSSSRGLPRWYSIVSIDKDHLVCNPWSARNDNTGTSEINIAKPYHLQRTPHDGQERAYPDITLTYTYVSDNERTATDGTDTESQFITEAYYVEDKIQAIKMQTNVIVSSVAVNFIDINFAGRVWASL